MKRRKKLFSILVARKIVSSKEESLTLIQERNCVVDGVVIENPMSEVFENVHIEIRAPKEFVSRGSLKLKGALEGFGLAVSNLTCADFGSSTGGFTDLLLQSGARRVYAVDTAKGELDWKLRSDDRVIVREGENVAFLRSFPEPIDLITVDISLVSLVEFLPAISSCLSENGFAIALLKPQYEVPVEFVDPGGTVSSIEALRGACCSVVSALPRHFLRLDGIMKSPIRGRGGNQEFLLLLRNRS